MNRNTAVEIPPLRVLRDRSPALPAPLTTFIGRERALGEVGTAIRSHRLITLTGPGGSGKTRLSIEVARSVADAYDDGVTWIELAPVTDPALVPQTVAAAFGLRQQQGRSAGEAVTEYLSTRRVLLVLDNCEHVIAATAEFVTELLRHAPHVHILATSRERIAVAGERVWPVPPLGLPPRRTRELDVLLGSESVRLFLERAAAVMPAFTIDAATAAAIADICVRVDGIPLAIELAAARMNVLAPRQIADRLADSMNLLTTGARTLPKRQRTLRAAIDWSYGLLSETERTLFRRLSVFAGTFTLDAAEAVCADARLPETEVLDLLASLVDKSLVTVTERDGEARYRMLDTVDQYATELLDAEGDAHATLQRHAEHYARIVDLYGPKLRSAARPRVMPILDAEHDNIRAALDWTRVTPDCADLHHRFVSRLWWYWVQRVYWDEGLQRLSAAIALSDGVDPVRYAGTLYGAGVLAWVSGVFLQSRLWLERCIELRREQTDPGPLGMALCALAPPLFDLGDRDEAMALAQEGLALARQGSAPWDVAFALTAAYGYVHQAGGSLDEAEQAHMEADGLWSDPADDWGRSLTHNSIAVISWRRGDLERAQAYARDALGFVHCSGDRWFASRSLQVLGYIAVAQSDLETATRLLAGSESLRCEVGARLMPFEVREWSRALEEARHGLGDTGFEAAWNEGVTLDFDSAIDFALSAQPAGMQAGADATPQQASVATPARQGGVVPVAAPAPRIEWPGRECDLLIRGFGAVEVHRDGRGLTNEDWTYARPRELLFYLLCHGAGATKEQIGLDLWPDASPAQLRSSFHVTVHHLRRALGAPEWVAFHEGRYRFEAAHDVAYDVTHFERCMDEAQALRASTSPDDVARRVQLLQSAIDVYRGHFLDDAGFGDWTLEPRDRLHRQFADAAVDLAACHQAAGRHDAAAATCRALLARDTLDERAHRLLIQALADNGRPADAVRHYGVMAALFREELGITPSVETRELVERLSHKA
ncbi:MAG TPA: BTAD domain-containing putative transcriptional regulator [Longimicrobiales bacterium]|nr:BTAD domain-containing putative transcriptional regulator [Longimicrobiales bacterium]